MSYFPHAFKKVFIGDTFVTTGKTEDLSSGEFGFFNPETWEAVAEGDALTSVNPNVVLAMGSNRPTRLDKVGPHGGYKESIKSQIITSYHVSKAWKEYGHLAQNQVVFVGWNGTTGTPAFQCGRNYTLRVDVKGSPALRLLGRDMYHNFDFFTGCCADEDEPTNVDPTVVLLGLAAQISNDPIFSQFVEAVVVNDDGPVDPDTYTALTDAGDIADAIAGLRLSVIYEDTTFSDCSFSPYDHYEREPVMVTSAQLVDESGDPCPSFTQILFTETQSPLLPSGTGDIIVRDFIMSQSYRQEFYHPDPRRRDVEGTYTMLDRPNRAETYDTYYILHSVPRKYNPTGVYDNDQYLLQLNVPQDMDTGNLDAWLYSFLNSANKGLDLAFLNQSS